MAENKRFPNCNNQNSSKQVEKHFDRKEDRREDTKYSNNKSSKLLRSPKSVESSLGILDMDGLSDFSSSHFPRESMETEKTKSRSSMSLGPHSLQPRNSEIDWQNRRPLNPINFSDIVEDRTIECRTIHNTPCHEGPSRHMKYTFEPLEMTGRSTACLEPISRINDKETMADRSPSVAQILASSLSAEIRELCTSFTDINKVGVRNSLPTGKNHRNSNENSWNMTAYDSRGSEAQHKDAASFCSDEFLPAEQMRTQMLDDEKDWQNEFGMLPADSPKTSKVSSSSDDKESKKTSKFFNLTEFSGILADNNCRDSSSDMSMGKFFSKRCEDVRDMIPNVSPTKRVKPVSLLQDSYKSDLSSVRKYSSQASSSFYTDDEFRIKSYPLVDNATYDKATDSSVPYSARTSVCSVSAIASQLDDLTQTPNAVISNLYRKKTDYKKNGKILQPLGDDVLYITKPIPFEKPQAPSKIDVINVEQYYGKLPDWNNFKNAVTVDTIGSKHRKILSSTAQNIPSENEHDKKLAKPNPNPDPDDTKQNKENCHQENFMADTESFSDSNLEFSSSDSFEYESVSEDSIAKDRKKPLKEMIKRQESQFKTSTKLGLVATEVPNKRARSPPSFGHKGVAIPSIPSTACESQTANDESEGSRNNEHTPTKHLQYSSSSSSARTNEIFNEQSDRHYMVPSSPVDGMRYSMPAQGLKRAGPLQTGSPGAVAVGRSSSQCSTNSEFTQYDGKFPLKSNKTELIWNCTLLRQSINKYFVIKNSALKRISFKVEVTGPGFQLSGTEPHTTMVLQGGECRTINVVFCPTVEGKARGKVVFKPTKLWPDGTQRTVQLFGYGGKTSLKLQGLERGPVGLPFLKMGETANLREPLTRSFVIFNKGPLNGVAYIGIKPDSGQRLNESSVSIQPNKCVIRPNSSVTIHVTYNLRRKDIPKLLQKTGEVLQVGVLEVITGSEANRLRLASLLRKEGTANELHRALDFLVSNFPTGSNENFDDFNESVENISEIFGFFKATSLALTINKSSFDETRDTECDFQMTGIEESLLFRTLEPDSMYDLAAPRNPPGNGQNGHVPNEQSWTVFPRPLRFNRNHPVPQKLIIRSNFQIPQTFQIDSNFCHLFTFSSRSGRIDPKQEYTVDVTLKTNVHIPTDVMLTVYIESDAVDVPVEVTSHYPAF